jgi:hypothetical protein
LDRPELTELDAVVLMTLPRALHEGKGASPAALCSILCTVLHIGVLPELRSVHAGYMSDFAVTEEQIAAVEIMAPDTSKAPGHVIRMAMKRRRLEYDQGNTREEIRLKSAEYKAKTAAVGCASRASLRGVPIGAMTDAMCGVAAPSRSCPHGEKLSERS